MDFIRKINQWEFFFRAIYQNRIVVPLRSHFPHCFFWLGVKNWYYLQTKKKLNYKKAYNINEKMMWLSRYWQHPLRTKCADKYLVREYIKELGMEKLLVPLIGVYSSVEEIDFNSLPNKFVLKCNHASGFNIVCTDKSVLNWESTKKKITSWMNIDYGTLFYEKHYSAIPRKIIIEQLLDIEPWEIQVYCINGKPDFLLVCQKCLNGDYKAYSYTLDWKRIIKRIGEEQTLNETLPKPSKLESLIHDAIKLAHPFPFVRVDFYQNKDDYYFAEMTFTPSANILHRNNEETINDMGKKLKLPYKLNTKRD